MRAKFIIGLTIGIAVLVVLTVFHPIPNRLDERVMHAQYTGDVVHGLARHFEAVIRDGETAIVRSRHTIDGLGGDSMWRLVEGGTFRDPLDHHFNTVYRVSSIDEHGMLLSYHRHHHGFLAGETGSDYGLVLVPYFVCWKTYEPLYSARNRWQSVLRSHENFLPCVPDIVNIGPGFGVLSAYALLPFGD